MLPQYYLYNKCNRTVLSNQPNFHGVHSRKLFKKALDAFKRRISKTKIRVIENTDIVRKESSHAWKPEAFPYYAKRVVYDLMKLGVIACIGAIAYGINKLWDVYYKKYEIAAQHPGDIKKNQEDLFNSSLVKEIEKAKEISKNQSVVVAEDCSKRSLLEQWVDWSCCRECVDVNRVKAKAQLNANKDQSNS